MIEEKVSVKPENSRPKSLAPLEIAAGLGLIIATIGLGISFKLLTRLWQSLAAFLQLDFSLDGMETRSNPFQTFDSPFPLFPVLMLMLWVACAAYLARKKVTFPPPAVNNRRLPVFKVVLAVLGIVAIVEVGLLVRSAQLLPTREGLLPASNFDEMVYYSASNVLASGYTPYKDFFLAHPPVTIGIFAGFFKMFGYSGGYDGFLAARWLCIILSLLTCAGIWWCAGRMWASGWGYRWLIGTVCGLVYAFDVRVGQVAVLETVSNFFAILALACFLLAPSNSLKPFVTVKGGGFAPSPSTGTLVTSWGGGEKPKLATFWLITCGILTALATLAKLPAGALLFGFVAYLAIKTQWKPIIFILIGFVATFAAIMGFTAIFAGVGEPLRQMLFFQLLRPQEVREGIDQIARIADYPEAGLTMFLTGIAIFVLAWRLWRGNLLNDLWLIPLLWSIPTMFILTAGKTFHPWYYVQWALPLALLIGVVIPTSFVTQSVAKRLTAKSLPLIGLISLLFLCIPLISRQWQEAHRPTYDAVYRPVGTFLAEFSSSTGELVAGRVGVKSPSSNSSVLTFDPGYSFMGKRLPAQTANGKLLVDSAGYMVYLNLEIDRRGWFDLLGSAIASNRERGQVEAIFRRDRAQAVVLTALNGGQWSILDGKIALPQLTPRTVEYIAGISGKPQKIGYVDLYPTLPNPIVREYKFDNGLILKPMSLSSSFEGKANFDALAPDGSLTLKSGETGTRTLDLRFLWWVNSSRNNPEPAKVFIHLLNEKGEKVAQRDIFPLDAKSNTQDWKPGDFYQDVHSLPLPPDLAPGRYQVIMGLYHPETLQQFSVEGKTFISLGYVNIT
jgi:hypothetical protein